MRYLGCLLCLMLLFSCKKSNSNKRYPRMIGDIAFEKSIDNPNFKLCNGDNLALQYFWGQNQKYIGEKIAVDSVYMSKYEPVAIDQSGLIRIRFIVNCKGEADRFRLIQMDTNYNAFTFDKRITKQLLEITKSIEKWVPKKYNKKPIDYYQYLIFKIDNGELTEIMP